jgi:hypothetical protein
MNKRIIFIAMLIQFASGCTVAPRNYSYAHVGKALYNGNYDQAAVMLENCAASSKNPEDRQFCANKLNSLKGSGSSVADALRMEARKNSGLVETETLRLARLRASNSPWDKYILFSELSAGAVEPIDPDETTRTAREAFAGFGDCAKETVPSCMSMYGELILRGEDSLDAKSKTEGRRKAMYWLKLAARYGYEPARRALVSEGEDIPTPDLAMERLQREANVIAKDAAINQDRAQREQAARDYEKLRESRRQTEQMIWANLFPKMVSCSANTMGSYTYTRCW